MKKGLEDSYMSQERMDALSRLKTTLTKQQMDDLLLVIQTADVQGDWNWNGEDSVWSDDVQSTLDSLARELKPEEPK